MSSKYIYTSYIKKLTPIEEFDMEKFILEVQKRECIWNVHSKSYNLKCIRNRETKKRAWEEIGRIFYPNWDNLAIEDRQKKVEGLSRKWANIRKYYTDEIRKPANSPPKKRQRRYHHLLTFLKDSVYKRRVPRINEFKNIGKEKVSANSSSDSESGELFIVEDAEELKLLSPENVDPPVAPALLDNKSNDPNRYYNDKRATVNAFWQSTLWEDTATSTKANDDMKTSKTGMVEKNPEITKLLNETRDPAPVDNMILPFSSTKPAEINVISRSLSLDQTAEASKRFLLSLLPEIMSLNVKQNMQFRLGIMDLLNDIKLRVNPNVNPILFPNININ